MMQFKWLIWLLISIPVFSNFHSAEELYLNKNYQKASVIYKEAVQSNQNNFATNYNLATTLYRLNDIVNAKNTFKSIKN